MNADAGSQGSNSLTTPVDQEALNDIMEVVTSIANGDLTKKISLHREGEMGEFIHTVNLMVDQLNCLASEITRISREAGTEGRFGGQAEVTGLTGTWKDLVNNINRISANLTNQVRDVSQVVAKLAEGDTSRMVTVNASGETQELKDNLNRLVERIKNSS